MLFVASLVELLFFYRFLACEKSAFEEKKFEHFW